MDNKNIPSSTEQDEINNVSFGKPHLFILGAGASKAAFPNGDRNGQNLPLMNDFVDVLELAPLLKQWGVEYRNKNFEDIYSFLHNKIEYVNLLPKIENIVFSYFSSLKLPSTPTLYDHLVLSLRPKDIIATFNWDPFLYLSLCRNHKHAGMPHPLFLHGNVGVGYCLKDKTMGVINQKCSKCMQVFSKTPLLYPVTKKNYNSDPFTKACWDEVTKFLESAYILTIFGYSAPETDVEAISLLKGGWGESNKRVLEEVEIIDLKDKESLLLAWEEFIHSHHYRVDHNFYDSFLMNHPRRSCEAMWEMFMQCNPYPERIFPKEASFDELWDWVKPLVSVEKEKDSPKEL